MASSSEDCHPAASVEILIMLLKTLLLSALAASGSSSPLVTRAGKTCTPVSGKSPTVDDTPAISSAIAACPSGTILIPSGSTYTIGSQLLFTGCAGCTLQIDGTLNVTTNFSYWNGKGKVFYLKGISGATIYSSTGKGVVQGNGQASWDYIVSKTAYARPYLWRIDSSTNIVMKNLTLQNAPSFHVVTAGGSKNIYYGNLTLHSVSTSSNPAHNTDGFDIGPASLVTVENVHVTNDDDCVVLKPGADSVVARDITCVGGHGLSVGSLGGSAGVTDSVSNSIFSNALMINNAKASGIKLHPGGSAYGSAVVTNVTWTDITVQGCQYGLQIQSCYSQTAAYCASNPSTAQLSGVVWNGVSGVTDGSEGNVVGNLDCPAAGTCGIKVDGMTLVAPSGKAEVLCANTVGSIGVTCTVGASG